ncbi:MAG: 50S ribosomal protein L10 [Chloroflexi bacterium]|nr:50S ribosomal protein L10 [Chloroflexota bacterium]
MAKREAKAKVIDELEEEFAKCNVGIFIDYRGLPTPEMTALRRKLQSTGNKYRVVKNTLARFAAERTGKKELGGHLKGPMAIAFGYTDMSGTARVVTDYLSESKANISIKGGFIGDTLLTPDQVKTLATLPSREILLAMVLGQMKAPVSTLAGHLASPLRGFIGILEGRMKQLEGK